MKGKIFSCGSAGWGIILLVILFILIFYSNCTKKSTRSYYKREYYLYASDTGGLKQKQIYIFSTESDSLVDSIYLGPNIYPGDLALSPDKRTLYVIAQIFDTISHTATLTYYEIDTRSKSIKYTGPNSNTDISPDGKYIIRGGEEFLVFDSHTHKIIYQESTLFVPECFNKRAPLVYGGNNIIGGERGVIRVFNYITKQWVSSYKISLRDGSRPSFDDYVLSPDGNTLYLIARSYDYRFYFCVFSLTQDSLLVQLEINSSGQLDIKPDGSIVYFTDPGGGGPCISIEPPPSGFLGVFDTKTNTPLPSISLEPLADSTHFHPLKPFIIKITPDGKKGYLSICRDWILVIDLIRNEPLRVISFPEYRRLSLIWITL
jgi:DNA-binding beta-propeller fold protein YncE